MSNDFLKLLEDRLAAAQERHGRALEELKFTRSEIEHLAGLIRLEENRTPEAAATAASGDATPQAFRDTGPSLVRDFLWRALPAVGPGKSLNELVEEAEAAQIPVEPGKSIARTLNANLLSMQTRKFVARDDGGRWFRAAALNLAP